MRVLRAFREFFAPSPPLREVNPSPLNREESGVVPINRVKSSFVPPNPYNDDLVNQKLKKLGITLIDINEELLKDFLEKKDRNLTITDHKKIMANLILFFEEKINQQNALEEQDQTRDSGIDPSAPGIPYSQLRRL